MKVAIVSLTDPHVYNHGGTLRIRAIASSLQTLGCEVVFFHPTTPTTTKSEENASAQPSLGERVVPELVRRFKRGILPMPTIMGGRNDQLRKKIQSAGPYDVVLLSALSQVQLVRDVDARLWFDFMDLWSDFAEHEVLVRRGINRLGAKLQASHLRRKEQQLSRSADIITAAGWADYERLRTWTPNAEYLPPVILNPIIEPKPAKGAIAKRVGFIGNFAFWPNRDAYQLLLQSWLEPLRAEGITVVVAGHESDQLPSRTGVELIGRVGQVSEFYDQVGATLAPIRLGGGVKMKIVESLTYGRPVLATPRAMEGLPPLVASKVVQISEQNPSFVGIEAAIRDGVGRSLNLNIFSAERSDRRVAELLSRIVT